jgi:hypothetical protein
LANERSTRKAHRIAEAENVLIRTQHALASLLGTAVDTQRCRLSLLELNSLHISWVDTLQEAKQAVRALQDAGYHAQDVHLIPSQEFIAGGREWKQRKSSLAQVVEIFLRIISG